MVTKFELAQYLVNLHTLIDAQRQNGSSLPSTVLAEEYDTNWGLLKDRITNPEETTDETRQRELPARGSETGTDLSRNQPGRSQRDRERSRP